MEQCKKCGKAFDLATSDHPNKGLMWNDDNQCWICQNCNITRLRKVVIGLPA